MTSSLVGSEMCIRDRTTMTHTSRRYYQPCYAIYHTTATPAPTDPETNIGYQYATNQEPYITSQE
eukprot:7995955-Prorocentrum_lima.AAC.1